MEKKKLLMKEMDLISPLLLRETRARQQNTREHQCRRRACTHAKQLSLFHPG